MRISRYRTPRAGIPCRWVAVFSALCTGFCARPAAAGAPVIRLVEQYEWQIVGIVILCILEALLIVALLAQQQRRRRAETELRDSEEHRR